MRSWIGIAVLYSVIAIAATWPVAGQIGRTTPGRSNDIYTGLWGLWYFHEALWRADVSLDATDMLFHPIGVPLGFHVQNVGAGILAEPLHLFGFSLPTLFSLSWLLTFPLSGLAAALLGTVASGSRTGGFVSGLVFMLTPFRTAHGLGQLELLGTQWMPLCAALLLLAFPPHGADFRPQRQRIALSCGAGLSLAMAFLASFYLGMFLGMFAALFLVWRTASVPEARQPLPLIAFTFGVIPPSLPFALPFLHAAASGSASYHLATASRYPADLLGFLLPTYMNPFLGPLNALLTGGARVWSGRPVEGTVGVGVVVIAMSIVGWRHTELLWRALAALFLVLSLGTSLHVLGRDLHVPLPYVLLDRIPVLRGARAPSRFVIALSLCLVPMVAAGVVRLVASLPARNRRLGVAVLVAIGGLELAACPYPTRDARMAEVVSMLATDPAPGAVLTLPDFRSQKATYLQTRHHRPLAGGFVSRIDDAALRRYQSLVQGAIGADLDPAAMRRGLETLGVRYVVVHEAEVERLSPARPWGSLSARLTKALGPPVARGDGIAIYRHKRGTLQDP